MSNSPWRDCPICSEPPGVKRKTVPPSGKVVACQKCLRIIDTDTGEILSRDRTLNKPLLERFVSNLNGSDIEIVEQLIIERKKS